MQFVNVIAVRIVFEKDLKFSRIVLTSLGIGDRYDCFITTLMKCISLVYKLIRSFFVSSAF